MKLKKALAVVTLWVASVSMAGGSTFAASPVQVFNLGKTKMIDSEVIAATNTLKKAKVTKLDVANTNFYAPSTRWEAALLTKRFATKFKKVKIQKTHSCSFVDVATVDWSIAKEISQSCKIGLFKGSNGKFMPHATFTRGQAIMVFARMLSNNPSLELHESYDYMISKGIIHVDDRANSDRPVPRSEIYLMMYRMLNKIATDPSLAQSSGFNIQIIRDVYNSIDLDEKTNSNTTTNPVNPNNPDGKVNGVTPEEASKVLNQTGTDVNVVPVTYDDRVHTDEAIPTGSSRLVISKAIVKNNTSNDIYLKDINFDIRGLVYAKSIKKITLLNEDNITINSASLLSDGTATLYPKTSYAVIPAGKTVNWYIAIDTSEDNKNIAGQSFKLWYKLNLDKDYKVGGSLEGETMVHRYVTYDSQTAVIEGYDTPVSKLYVGETQKLIGSFQLTAGAKDIKSRKDIYLEKIVLTNEGGRLEDRIKNVVFKIGDAKVSKDVHVNRNTITASFVTPTEQKNAQNELANDVKSGEKTVEKNSYGVERGDTVIVDIYADIIGGSHRDRIELELRNGGDIVAKEVSSKVPVLVRLNDPKTFKKFEIYAGKIVIGRASNSPIVDTVSVNSASTNVLTFQVTSPSKLQMDKLQLQGELRNRTAETVDVYDVFKSVKVYQCGTTPINWTSSNSSTTSNCSFVEEAQPAHQNVASGSTGKFKLDSSVFTIPAGITTYEVRIETDRFAPKNVDFNFTVDKDSFINPYNDQDDTVEKSSIVGSASSNFWNIGTNHITVSYVNNETLDYVKGKTDSYLGDIYVTSPSSKNLKLNSLRVKLFSPTSDPALQFEQLLNAKLKNDKGIVGEPKSVDSNGYVTFDNLNLKVDSGTQLKLKLYVDISSNFYTTDTQKTIKWTIESNSSKDILFTAGKGSTVEKSDVTGLPIVSGEVNIFPTAKTFIYKDGDQPEGKILYNNDNKFQEVLKFKVKSKYDDVKLKDLYVVAWTGGAYDATNGTGANIQTAASNVINQIRYKGNKTTEASVINGIARFTDLNDTFKANTDKDVTIALQVANIHKIDADNQAIQMAVVLKIEDNNGYHYKTKFISLANGNVLSAANIDLNDQLISAKQVLRKTMIEANASDTKDLSKEILNGSEHKMYQLAIKNLGRSKAKVKSIALPFTINNAGAALTMNNFKLEVSNNGGKSFRSWSEMKNNVEFAVKEAGVALDSSDWKAADLVNVSEAANKNYVLYARFVNNYNNGYDIPAHDTIVLRVNGTIAGADQNSDVVAFEAKSFESGKDWSMGAYTTEWEAGVEAANTVIWTDNADADGNTAVADANWFEDHGIEGKYSTHSLNYKS